MARIDVITKCLLTASIVWLAVHESWAKQDGGTQAEARFGFGLGPPPGYKHTAFRLIVPQHALASLHWHDALRHAAFLSLRRRINSHDGNAQRAEMALWQRLTAAPVSPLELAKPVYEDADITTLASGVLLREAGHLAFLPESSLLQQGTAPRKVSALWSVLRVRHSGPGLGGPRVELYFTVQPASHLSLLDHSEKQQHTVIFKKVIPRPTILFKEVPNKIPVYSRYPGQYYNPQFVNSYRNSIHKFVSRPENGQTILTVNQGYRNPNEPIYILPTPRFVQPPTFPRLSGLVPQQGQTKLVNILIPREQANYQQENDVQDYDTQESQPQAVVRVAQHSSKFVTSSPVARWFGDKLKTRASSSTEDDYNDERERSETSTVATTFTPEDTTQETVTENTTVATTSKILREPEAATNKRNNKMSVKTTKKEEETEILHLS